MATVYSLVCWGGLTGKTVTLSIASPCVVTSTNHGLRDGTGLRFKGNGDTLPTGLTSGVTYYTKSTAANTFNLYSDAALTTIINTSGSQSGTHVLQSLLVADPANALAPFGLSDLSRYGASGSERVYGGLVDWNAGRAGASNLDEETCEIAEAFTEMVTYPLTISIPSALKKATTDVNGIRSYAFHSGIVGSGFIFDSTKGSYGPFTITKHFTTLDGFTARSESVNANPIISLNAVGCNLLNMIVHKMAIATSGVGITATAASSSTIKNCLVIGNYDGIELNNYVFAHTVANNTIVKSIRYGVMRTGEGTFPIQGNIYNNISVGNGTNWQGATSPTMLGGSKNAGISGDVIWNGTGGTTITMATTDFADYANNDFRPALSTSPQVDSGVSYYGIPAYDITDAEMPNYNNGGAEAVDVGAYEFDHGYGPHPASTTVTFSGVNAGSEIRIYDSTGVELTGIESCASNQALSWVIPVGDVRIVIVNTAYKIKEFDYTSTVGNVSLPVQQEPDKWYRNPV